MCEKEILNVRPGDVVILHSGYPYRKEELQTVVKVTPTGRIRVSGCDDQFDKYGRRMGYPGYGLGVYIQVATQEDIKRVSENKIIDRGYRIIQKVKKADITYESALQIIKLFEHVEREL